MFLFSSTFSHTYMIVVLRLEVADAQCTQDKLHPPLGPLVNKCRHMQLDKDRYEVNASPHIIPPPL